MAASIMEFSPNGELFAFCGPDGTLRIWDTATNSLKQEYVSSSHLSATCTCLNWRPERKNEASSKRKKRKSEVEKNSKGHVDLIALGTSSGSVLLYSVLRGDLQSQWDGGHQMPVNGLSWTKTEHVYSCSSDSYIIEWDVVTGKSVNKMKNDGPVHSICLCKDDSMLLSASQSIKLWDLSTHQVVQNFTGHATEVFCLLSVPNLSANDCIYFLSAAKNDRYVQVWQAKTTSKSKHRHSALASLQLTDDVAVMSIFGPMPDDGAYLFSVVTESGWLLLFRQVLNGEKKKPLQPKVKLQIATSDAEVPQQLSILSAHIGGYEELVLSYGNPLKPVFEKINYGGLNPENCLVREDASMKVDKVSEVSKTRTPLTPDDAKMLIPGHMVPSKPTQTSGKKKRQRTTSVDMTVEERLDVMGLNEKTETPNLQTTSSAVLLAQGLQSKDAQILNHVLQNTNPAFVRNTIRKLPIPLIIPLVDELSKRMQGHAQASKAIIGWTKSLLTIHSSYLMTFPELVQNLSSLYQMMDSRVTMFGRLSKLQGKLELILSQVSDQSALDPSDPIEALVTLQDESSDEDDMLVPENDDSPNWEDDDGEDESEMEADDDDDEEEDPKELAEGIEDSDDDVDENGMSWAENDEESDEG